MKKIISYPISFIFLLVFLLALLVFHPIQLICFTIFGYKAHKKSVDYLNWCLLKIGHLLGSSYKFNNRERIPSGVPIIFVANHQSLYDIIAMIWFLRKFHPKFVSKKELGKGIPSVSYNLRHGGSVLIDRKDSKQAIPEIKKAAEYVEKYNRSIVIFPEGTRTKTGKPREFAQSGLKILCKYAPSAYVVPITINNAWKLTKYGTFPYGLGTPIVFDIHEPMTVKDHDFSEIMETTERKIIEGITKINRTVRAAD